MDSLSTSLNSTNIRGHIGGQLLKNVCYVDDLCLNSMSSAGMQRLLNMFKDYAEQHSLHLLLVRKTVTRTYIDN